MTYFRFLSKNFFIFIIVWSFFCVSSFDDAKITNLHLSSSSYEDLFKKDDFVSYKMKDGLAMGINQTGYLDTNPVILTGQTSTLSFLIENISDSYLTTKISIKIGNIYSNSSIVFVKNRQIYQLDDSYHGYLPFWIPSNVSSQNQKIPIEGLSTNPVMAKVLYSSSYLDFLGGFRETFGITAEKNNNTPVGVTGVYEYSKNNGILIKFFGGIFPWLLGFKYVISGTWSISDTNIDFGPINYFAYILFFIASGGWIIILGGIVFLSIFIFIRRSKNKTKYKSKLSSKRSSRSRRSKIH